MKKIGFLTALAAILVLLFAGCKDYPSSIEVIYPKAPAPNLISIEELRLPGQTEASHALLTWTTGGDTTFFEIVRRQNEKQSVQVILTENNLAWNDTQATLGGSNAVNPPNWVFGEISNIYTFTPDITKTTTGFFDREQKMEDKIDTDRYQAIVRLEDLYYAAPNGTPYYIGVRAFSQFNNRWSTYSDIKWSDNTFRFKAPPVADLITVNSPQPTPDDPAVTGVGPNRELRMGRATYRTFTADVRISEGTAPSTDNQEIDWVLPAYYLDSNGQPDLTRPADTDPPVLLPAGADGVRRWAITVRVPYTDSPGDRIRLTARYTTTNPDRLGTIPKEDLDATPPVILTGFLTITVSDLPPGLPLINNYERIGRFTVANPDNSRFFYFEKPADTANDYFIRYYARPDTITDLGNPFATWAEVYLRFYDANGQVIRGTYAAPGQIDGGAFTASTSLTAPVLEVKIDGELTTIPYSVRVSHAGGQNFVEMLGNPNNINISGNYKWASIEVRRPTASPPMEGNFAIDWTSSQMGPRSIIKAFKDASN